MEETQSSRPLLQQVVAAVAVSTVQMPQRSEDRVVVARQTPTQAQPERLVRVTQEAKTTQAQTLVVVEAVEPWVDGPQAATRVSVELVSSMGPTEDLLTMVGEVAAEPFKVET